MFHFFTTISRLLDEFIFFHQLVTRYYIILDTICSDLTRAPWHSHAKITFHAYILPLSLHAFSLLDLFHAYIVLASPGSGVLLDLVFFPC
jgi:hypothetical protein